MHNLTELVKDTWLHEFTAKTKEKKMKLISVSPALSEMHNKGVGCALHAGFRHESPIDF